MILHVDLDAFYASVEQRDRPELRGRPVLVGTPSARAVVLAASYEARPFGCHSAMPMAAARRLCPQAVVVAPRMDFYQAVSTRFVALLESFTPLCEPISIDEAYLDIATLAKGHDPAREVAQTIKARVRAELGLTASVGVAAVKLVAKIASDLGKPDGLVVVPAAETSAFLTPLPVERLFGVGPKTAATLRALGMTTLGQVASYPLPALAARLGARQAAALQRLARGEDGRPVEPDRQRVSIGAEETFERDLPDGPALQRAVREQAERVAERLRRGGKQGKVVVLKLKDAQFHLTTRRRTLATPTADGRVIGEVALALLAAAPPKGGVRLSGVAATELSDADAPRQLSFDEPARARGERLGATLDRIRDRFGATAVTRGGGSREEG